MKRYKIIDKDALPAHRWIENQIKNLVGYFSVGDTSKAHDTFSKLKPNDANGINGWGEKYLDKAQWGKMEHP